MRDLRGDAMYLLDTSALIEIMNATETGAELLLKIGESPISITPFTRYEYLYSFSGKRLEQEKKILRNLPVLEFDSDCADLAVDIHNALKSKGKMINESDIYISALCKKHNLVMVTLDKHYKNIPGLKVYFIESK
jgi:predicted nucleic acid-binding protein